MSVRVLDGLAEVADQYDLFIIDQWGVLHNGETPHAGAVDVLRELRRAGKTITILSNSGKRLAVTQARMADMGFTDDLYDHCVTSGEEVWQALNAASEPFYADLGAQCLMLTWDGDNRLIEGLPLREVDSVEDADFILNAGTTNDQAVLKAMEPMLQRAAARGLPMVCANPDFVSKAPDGSLAICPGTTAKRYEVLGGRVDYRGKPHAPVYRKCFELAPNHGPTLAIGDSLCHDIGGANGAGIDSLFISGGIHAEELSDLGDPYALAMLFNREGQTPTYAAPALRW
ncbi:MAG: TIGR01459 family HAD-type hydrolase [Alphaproteobacteria bacterium]|nr:TIGR01459 family HAD-type hydrolase [Alphaproteobacteria bacterium]